MAHRLTRFSLLAGFVLLVSGQGCPTTTSIPDFNNAKLPSPFSLNDGTPVSTSADWDCRREQVSALIQGYEAGSIPEKPSVLTATFSKSGTRGTLSITTGSSSSQTISFSAPITFPNGDPPQAGWPLIIAYGAPSIPIPDGIAVLNFNNDQIGQQSGASSRGQGLFFDLYGADATASAMTAWAWGVSRIIDALESTPQAQINVARIGVTGCSRNGKGALMAGAFEPRIALTIPQESGSGGDTCWRLSKFEQDSGQSVQEAVEIVQENVWFSSNFENFVNQVDTLPYDHHLLAAMVAPRPMISYENTDVEWLSPLSAFGCMSAAHSVWEALGVPDLHGFVQAGGHAHCAFPSSLNPTLNAFIDRFLLDREANTTIFQTNNLFAGVPWQASDWIDWTTPSLA